MLPYIQFNPKTGQGWPGAESVGEPGADGFYRTIGRCIGLSLNNSDVGLGMLYQYLVILVFPVRLSIPFFRILIGEELSVDNLSEVDEDFVNHLKTLLTYAEHPEELGLSFAIARILPDVKGNNNIGITAAVL